MRHVLPHGSVAARRSGTFRWRPTSFGSPHAQASMFQQLYSTDDSTLLQGSLTIWMPTEGLRLVASGGPQGGAPTPGLSRRQQTAGSQRVPLLTVMKRQWRG